MGEVEGLKRCPKCAGRAEMHSWWPMDWGGRKLGFAVMCKRCRHYVQRLLPQQARLAWNRTVAPQTGLPE